MSCTPLKKIVLLSCLAIGFAGCYPTKPMYLNDTGDLSYYLDQATQIEYPDVQSTPLAEVTQSLTPITVIDTDFQSFFDLTLEECIGIALQNSKVIRGYGTPGLQGTRVSPGIDNLTNGPAGAGTFYNIAIRETEAGFIGTPGQLSPPGSVTTATALESNQGVEAALADFDAQFTSNLFWNKTHEPRNVVNNSPIDRFNFRQDQVQFQSELAKKSASGTQFLARNINIYTSNNIPLGGALGNGFQALPTWWRASFEFEVRQPLLRGRGAFINRMPIMIARIGTDQELANLESQLQNMVTNIEIRYWELNCAYRNLEASKAGRNAAHETWWVVYKKYEGGADVTIQQVAQASEQYHFFDEQVIDAYNTLLSAEGNIRYLLGIATTDGQIIRPIDEPVLAPIEFEWCAALDEALTYRPEVRQQRWELKKRELQIAYAKNSLLPQLNATGLYRVVGLGDGLLNSGSNGQIFPDPGSGAYDQLWSGSFNGFQAGLDFGLPVGFRRELANVRNAQLKLAREHARMEDMELDFSRELAEAFRALAANRRVMQTSFNRWADTTIETQHFKNLEVAGVELLDVALDSQRRRAQAEIAFYTALCEYNKVIALIHRRKGTILAYDSVDFSEGPWTGKAYQDASENARRRSASPPMNYGWSRPDVISTGAIWPDAGTNGVGPSRTQALPGSPVHVDQVPYGNELSEPFYEPIQIEDAATNGNESFQTLDQPPLSNNAIRSPVISDPSVQQTSWTLASGPQQTSGLKLDNAIRRTAPARDMNTAPVASSNPVTSQQEQIDWNRFGMNPQNTGPAGVQANIRMNQ